jgi:hypothetical protein
MARTAAAVSVTWRRACASGGHLRLSTAPSATTRACSTTSTATSCARSAYDWTWRTYFDELAGLADPELIAAALERDGVEVDDATHAQLVALRVSEYLRRAGADPPVRAGSRALIEGAARVRVALAIGSGALRAEVEHVSRRRACGGTSGSW